MRYPPAGEGGCEGENLTFEEALEAIGGNATHGPYGHLYEEQWADYEGYEWEVNLLSETGKYDVLWLDVVESIRLNNHGDFGKINAAAAKNDAVDGSPGIVISNPFVIESEFLKIIFPLLYSMLAPTFFNIISV